MDILLRPVVSEKSEALSKLRKYVFICHLKATKPQIKKAVEEIFNVKVSKVNTMIYRGKTKRRGIFIGKRPNFKKAIVTLKDGTIDFAKITEKFTQAMKTK